MQAIMFAFLAFRASLYHFLACDEFANSLLVELKFISIRIQ